MRRYVSDTIADAVEAALPTRADARAALRGGVRPGEIEGTGYAVTTIRKALIDLVAMGRAGFEGPDCGRRYWRVAR